MTRLHRISPLLFTAVLAACQQAQPYVQAPEAAAPLAVVMNSGLQGDREAQLKLGVAGYALLANPSPSTVHRWVPADIVRYDVELKQRNATSLAQFDSLTTPVVLEVPVSGNGAGQATFSALRQGSYYRAYVKAMGRRNGSTGTDTIQALNTSATDDFADFDFTAANDVVSQVQQSVTIDFDGVAFSGVGNLSFGTPSPGAYVNPSQGPAATVVSPSVLLYSYPNAPVATNITNSAFRAALGPQGEVWVGHADPFDATVLGVASAGTPLMKAFAGFNEPSKVAVSPTNGQLWVGGDSGGLKSLSSTGGSTLVSLSTAPIKALAVDAQGNAWVATSTGIERRNSAGTLLGSLALSNPTDIDFDAQGQAWVALGTSSQVAVLSSQGALLSSYAVGSSPTSVEVLSNGDVWVASTNLITRLNSQGSFLSSVTSTGARFLAKSPDGTVWVSVGSSGTAIRRHNGSTGAYMSAITVGGWVGVIQVGSDGAIWLPTFSGDLGLRVLRPVTG